jgi:peptide/nickel transport system ATP-binding protein
MIAMALALEPALLIADEPTTALDVTTQAEILPHPRPAAAQRHGRAVHHARLGVVAEIADRVAVMQHGVLVESGVRLRPLEHRSMPGIGPDCGGASAAGARAVRPARRPPPCQSRACPRPTTRATGWARSRTTHAVKDVSFNLPAGTTLGWWARAGRASRPSRAT